MNLQEPLEISREKMVVNLLFVNSILCGFNSCFFLFLLSRKEWGVCWLLAGFTLFIVFLWGKKTPYMRVTNTELMIFPSLLHSPMFISWGKIQNIHIGKNKVELILLGNKKVKIFLHRSNRKELEHFTKMVKEFLNQRKSVG